MVALMLKINDVALKTAVEFSGLLISMLAFYFCGFDLLLKLGLYRNGDQINLLENSIRTDAGIENLGIPEDERRQSFNAQEEKSNPSRWV
jgi:hypothetical protein